jgi:hypothetical protein
VNKQLIAEAAMVVPEGAAVEKAKLRRSGKGNGDRG